MTSFITRFRAWLLDDRFLDDRFLDGRLLDGRFLDDRGQATTEYALVLLGAALIALLVIGWATTGGGSDKVGQLFDSVIDSVIGKL